MPPPPPLAPQQTFVHAITFEQLFGFLSFLAHLLALIYRLPDYILVDFCHDLDLQFSRSNMEFATSQPKKRRECFHVMNNSKFRKVAILIHYLRMTCTGIMGIAQLFSLRLQHFIAIIAHLTLKWLGHFFQNVISFSDAVHLMCNIFIWNWSNTMNV